MYIQFDFLGDAQKLSLAKRLKVAPNHGNEFSLEATIEHADQLLRAARVHCLSKVTLLFQPPLPSPSTQPFLSHLIAAFKNDTYR